MHIRKTIWVLSAGLLVLLPFHHARTETETHGAGPDTDAPALSVREQSRRYVEECASKVAEGTIREVDASWKAICRRHPTDSAQDIYQGDHAAYRLVREAGRVRIDARIQLEIHAGRKGVPLPKARTQFILERTRQCMPVMNQYWNRYGVQLNFTFEHVAGKPRPGATAAELANRVAVTDGPGRSNSRNFYFRGIDIEQKLPYGVTIPGGPGFACVSKCKLYSKTALGSLLRGVNCEDACEPARQQEFCNMLTHEFGHRLGLPDEYADPMCTDREFVSEESYPFSIMGMAQMGLLDTPAGPSGAGIDTGMAELFPRHLKRVVGPLCGESEL